MNPLADYSPTVAQNGHRHVGSATSQIYTAFAGNKTVAEEKKSYVSANDRFRKVECDTQGSRNEQNEGKQRNKEEMAYKPVACIFWYFKIFLNSRLN
jgi:hypothetical protein